MKTRTYLDATSINRVRAAGYAVYRDLGILEGADHERSNYLLFTYDIERAPDLGTAWSDVMIAEMAPAAEMDFLIREQEGRGFAFDLERALAAYARMATSGQPLRLLGFPAFMFHTLLEVERRGCPGCRSRCGRAPGC
jgi:hypothetical protein